MVLGRGLRGGPYLLKILRVSMISLKATKFSMRQLKRSLASVSGEARGVGVGWYSRYCCRLGAISPCKHKKTSDSSIKARKGRGGGLVLELMLPPRSHQPLHNRACVCVEGGG